MEFGRSIVWQRLNQLETVSKQTINGMESGWVFVSPSVHMYVSVYLCLRVCECDQFYIQTNKWFTDIRGTITIIEHKDSNLVDLSMFPVHCSQAALLADIKLMPGPASK